jgi:hypothetical protein
VDEVKDLRGVVMVALAVVARASASTSTSTSAGHLVVYVLILRESERQDSFPKLDQRLALSYTMNL